MKATILILAILGFLFGGYSFFYNSWLLATPLDDSQYLLVQRNAELWGWVTLACLVLAIGTACTCINFSGIPRPSPSPQTIQCDRRFVLMSGLILYSWPMMMLFHELGHLLGAWITGGGVRELVWHPLVFSRTDVDPNPSPLIVAWMGPLVGVALPLLAAAAVRAIRLSSHYLFAFFAGFCLIANGAYLAIGSFEGVGDAGDMMAHRTPRWVLIVFGGVTVPLGFWLWHRVSHRLRFGPPNRRLPIPALHAYAMLTLGILVIVIGLIFGNRGV